MDFWINSKAQYALNAIGGDQGLKPYLCHKNAFKRLL